MKVILLTDIRGTGRKGDIKEVREGYARNFLLPRGLAKVATASALVARAAHDAARVAAREARRKEAEGWIVKLAEEKWIFPVKTGAKGEVFGSVTAKDIARELTARGYSNVTVEFPKPLKTLGDHRVALDLGEGIQTTVTVNVAAAEKS